MAVFDRFRRPKSLPPTLIEVRSRARSISERAGQDMSLTESWAMIGEDATGVARLEPNANIARVLPSDIPTRGVKYWQD